MHIYTKDVTRINSVGVKAWIKYFQGSMGKSKLRFLECSPAIVEQINLISNFTCGGIVETIYLPFSCGSCRAEMVAQFKCEDLKKINFNIPDSKCPK